jgi:hypothetical protein
LLDGKTKFKWGKRHTLGILLICCNIICYLDRANMSIGSIISFYSFLFLVVYFILFFMLFFFLAIIPMAQDLNFNDEQKGLVLSAFYAGYLFTQSIYLNCFFTCFEVTHFFFFLTKKSNWSNDINCIWS